MTQYIKLIKVKQDVQKKDVADNGIKMNILIQKFSTNLVVNLHLLLNIVTIIFNFYCNVHTYKVGFYKY